MYARADIVRALRESVAYGHLKGSTFILLHMVDNPKEWVPESTYKYFRHLIVPAAGKAHRNGKYDVRLVFSRLSVMVGMKCRCCGRYHLSTHDDEFQISIHGKVFGDGGDFGSLMVCNQCKEKFYGWVSRWAYKKTNCHVESHYLLKSIDTEEESSLFVEFISYVIHKKPKWFTEKHRSSWTLRMCKQYRKISEELREERRNKRNRFLERSRDPLYIRDRINKRAMKVLVRKPVRTRGVGEEAFSCEDEIFYREWAERHNVKMEIRKFI